MGRPERPIDPEAGPLQAFAFDLRRMRQAAGAPSYRKLARLAHYSVTTLSDAAGGERLPTLAVTLGYVEACGGDRKAWEARWQAVAVELAADDHPVPAVDANDAPYLGLAAFQPEDAERFFGRERLVDELVSQLAETPFLAVFGASGSGKSSLLRAGLLPALQAGRIGGSQHWPILLLTPGAHPLEELAIQVAKLLGIPASSLLPDLEANPASFDLAVRQALATEPQATQLVVVVDQFEELFTLCQDEGERASVIQALLSSMGGPSSRARLVLSVRADFYSRCAGYPELVTALRNSQVLVGPMDADELRRVITEPATRAGLEVEGELVATILADVVGRPGALPLLSHALLETWRRCRGAKLTLADYKAARGVQGAIAQTAEQLYVRLDSTGRNTAQSIFLRLTALGEGTEDTRRRVTLAELGAGDANETRMVLDRLAAARLISLGEDSVEVAHEALIGAWPRLRQWLADDREGLRAHRRLTEAATEWDQAGRDEGLLYRGVRLAYWSERDRKNLNDLERGFLDASRHREGQERKAARRRVRLALMGLSLALVAITAVAVIALLQRNAARSRQLAASASGQLALDPERSLLLAIRAFKTKRTEDAEVALRQALLDSSVRARLEHKNAAFDATFSPDGRGVVSAGSDGTVRVWDWQSGRVLRLLRGHTGEVRSAEFSPDGRRVVSAGSDGTVRVWDWESGTALKLLGGHGGRVSSAGFSMDGRRVVSAGSDGVQVWDWESGTALMVPRGRGANSAAFSPDGRRVISTGPDGVQVWDWNAGTEPMVLRGHGRDVYSAAFSPDGLRGISAGSDGVRVWEWANVTSTVQQPFPTTVQDATFSRDGQRVVVACQDGTVWVWEWATASPPVPLRGHQGFVNSASFSPDGRWVVTAGSDGTVRVWQSPSVPLRGHKGQVYGVAFSADGRRVASAGEDGTVRVWDGETRKELKALQSHKGQVNDIAFSPDSRRVVSAGADATVRVWDWQSDDPPVVLLGHHGWVYGPAFSPDGRRIVSAGADKTVRVWDWQTGKELKVLQGHRGQVYSATFSPDGRRVVSASEDATVRIWDWETGKELKVLVGHTRAVIGAAFSPDGRRVVSAGQDNTVRVWEWESTNPPVVLRGHEGLVEQATFSPDGHWVVSAAHDKTVRIWEWESGNPPMVLRDHEDSVTSAAFSPDGQRVVSASWDGTVRMRRCDSCEPIDKVLQLAQKRVTRALSPEERETFLH